jgi:uncharacterized membrane protein YtjA (UPF0391 family)
MLCWSSTYLVVALIATLFGLIKIATSVAGLAKALFFIFFTLFSIALIIGGNNSEKKKG